MINQFFDIITHICTNLMMALMGEAPLDGPTLIAIILVGVVVVGIGSMVALRLMRPTPLPPIIVNNAAPAPNPMIPVMIMFVVLFVVIGGGVFIYLAR